MTDKCTAEHCGSVSQQINDTCKANGWPVNHLVLVCNNNNCCTCTCSCLAFDTPVRQSPSATKAIQTFIVGDPVLAYDPDGQSEIRNVAFSDGTSPASVQPEMAYMSFQIGTEERTVTATLNHTFLRADRKLIQAQMLRPGCQVLLADGTLTQVTKLEINSYTGGVWNISTSIGKPKDLNGHLLDTDGILSGDFAVQLFYDELAAQGLAVPRGNEPAVTTRAHDAMIEAQAATRSRKYSLAARPTQDLASFLAADKGPATLLRGTASSGGEIVLHGDHRFTLEVPKQALNQGFLTDIQAKEAQHAQQPRQERDPQRIGYSLWLFKLFQSFYPDTHFIVDAATREANAYAFRLGTQPYVLVQGGLVRAEQLEWQGLALVLGYLVSRFSNAQPLDPQGLLCKPAADYLAPSILQTVFNPLYPTVIFDAINQVEALFSHIPTQTDQPETGCHGSNLACRVETYRRAIAFETTPTCAGGPPAATLRLLYALPGADLKAPVTLAFNEPLEQKTAQNIANYFLDPPAKILSVINSQSSSNTVQLTANLAPSTNYSVTVSDLISVDGNTLSLQYTSTAFLSPDS